ncbi:hypothetical protein [Candidatus Cardinium hertigii]|nr:hypothetical protein [Candidatus Cardinium hertigii]
MGNCIGNLKYSHPTGTKFAKKPVPKNIKPEAPVPVAAIIDGEIDQSCMALPIAVHEDSDGDKLLPERDHYVEVVVDNKEIVSHLVEIKVMLQNFLDAKSQKIKNIENEDDELSEVRTKLIDGWAVQDKLKNELEKKVKQVAILEKKNSAFLDAWDQITDALGDVTKQKNELATKLATQEEYITKREQEWDGDRDEHEQACLDFNKRCEYLKSVHNKECDEFYKEYKALESKYNIVYEEMLNKMDIIEELHKQLNNNINA